MSEQDEEIEDEEETDTPGDAFTPPKMEGSNWPIYLLGVVLLGWSMAPWFVDDIDHKIMDVLPEGLNLYPTMNGTVACQMRSNKNATKCECQKVRINLEKGFRCLLDSHVVKSDGYVENIQHELYFVPEDQ